MEERKGPLGVFSGVGEKIARYFREQGERNQRYVLSAIDSLSSEGKLEVTLFDVEVRYAELRHPGKDPLSLTSMISSRSVYPVMNYLLQSGELSVRRVEIPGEMPQWFYSRTQRQTSV